MNQLSMTFSVHKRERTQEGQAILSAKKDKLTKNCALLVRYWQKNNIWLSDDNSRAWLNVKNLAQRVADLRHVNKIPVESRLLQGNYKEYRLQCTCKLIGGQDVTDGCYAHSTELKIV